MRFERAAGAQSSADVGASARAPRGSASQLDEEELALLELVWELAQATRQKIDRLNSRSLHLRTEPNPVPEGNPCRDAPEIEGGATPVVTLATRTDGAASCAVRPGMGGVWFKYVAPREGVASFTTEGGELDTVLSLHPRCPDGETRELACNDDHAFSVSSRVAGSIAEGDVLRLQVLGQAEFASE